MSEMKISWRYEQGDISWEELSALYKIASLGDKSPKNLETVFTNSQYKCFIFSDSILIGVGRALADGVDCSYLCDIAIHPDFQGLGLGKQIVDKLVEFSSQHKKIILYANPGKEGFYSKLGFKKMNTAMAIFKDEQRAFDVGLIQV